MGRRLPIEQLVATRVRALREAQGLSQADLARVVGTSRSQVAAVERGDRAVTLATVESFARALGVKLVDVVGAVERRPNAPPDQADRLAAEIRARGPAYVRAAVELFKHLEKLEAARSRRS